MIQVNKIDKFIPFSSKVFLNRPLLARMDADSDNRFWRTIDSYNIGRGKNDILSTITKNKVLCNRICSVKRLLCTYYT